MADLPAIVMLDVIVLLEDLPEYGLQKGDKGTVVDISFDGALLLDCSDIEKGELCLPSVSPDQVRLYWRAETQTYVSPRDALRERVAGLTDEEAAAALSFIEKLQVHREPVA